MYSRRAFLTHLSFIATALHGAEKKEGYKTWFEQNIKHTNTIVRHPKLTRPYAASEKQREILKRAFTTNMPGIEIESIECEVTIGFNPFVSTPQTWAEYEKRQKETAQKMFELIGRANEVPSVNLEALTLETSMQVQQARNTPLTVYVADAFFAPSIRANIRPKRNNTAESQLVYALNIVTPVYSGFIESNEFDVTGTIKKSTNTPIFLSSKTPLSSYLALSEELLHWAMSPHTHAEVEKNAKKRTTNTPEEIEKMMEQANTYEEGIVHAVSQHFAERTMEETGFTREEIEERWNKMVQHEKYKKALQAYKFLKEGSLPTQFKRARENYERIDA